MIHLFGDLYERRPPTGMGVLLSVVLHAVVAIAIVSAPREIPPDDQVMESLVQYLVPADRVASNRQAGQEGSLAWHGEGEGGSGEDTGAAGTTEGDQPAGVELTTGGGSPPAQREEPTDEQIYQSMLSDSVHSVVEVDSSVVRYPNSAAPHYPPELLRDRIQGSAFVLYVVDSTGTVDPKSLRVIRATHPDFVEAVREALPRMRFRPAILRGRPVNQLVQQSFAFRITTPAPPKPGPDTTRRIPTS